MKKTATIVVIFMFLVLVSVTSCGSNTRDLDTPGNYVYGLGDIGIVNLNKTGYDGLVYDSSTKTVLIYYYNSLSTYIHDGHYCKFVDGHIVVNPCCDPNCRYSGGDTIVDPEKEQ